MKPSNVTHVEPFLITEERLDAERVRELIAALRRLGGEELLVKAVNTPGAAAVAASRLRRVLGTDFVIRTDYSRVFARCRLSTEPEFKGRKMRRTDDWMTYRQAADALGMTTYWLKVAYVDKGLLVRHRYSSRVVFARADVEALRARTLPSDALPNTVAIGQDSA